MAPLDFNAPTAAEAAEIRRRKAAITRRIRKQVLAELGIDRLPRRGERTLVTGAQGTGKSRTCAETIARLPGGGLSFWWLVPSLEKADEQAARVQPPAHHRQPPGARRARPRRARSAHQGRRRHVSPAQGGEPRRGHGRERAESDLRQRLLAPVLLRLPAPGHGAARGSDRPVPHGERLPVAAMPGAAPRSRDRRRVRGRQGDRYRELRSIADRRRRAMGRRRPRGGHGAPVSRSAGPRGRGRASRLASWLSCASAT